MRLLKSAAGILAVAVFWLLLLVTLLAGPWGALR